jgi:hypothetical protein
MKKFFDELRYDAEFIRGHTLQPQWYKILKVFILAGFLSGFFFLFGLKRLLIFCVIFFGLAFAIHLAYRINTKRYTRSWLDFKVEKIDGKLVYERIGVYYYLAVSISLVIAFLVSLLLEG